MIKRYITEQTFEFNERGHIVRETVTTTEEYDDNFYGGSSMFQPYWMNPGITGYPMSIGLPSSTCECDGCCECDCELEIEDEVKFPW